MSGNEPARVPQKEEVPANLEPHCSGGLGLTGGIVDCGGLYDCLAGIYDSKTDDAILDRYSEVRRQKYQEIVDPISSENLRRLFDQDPERAMETDEFLKLCKRASTDHEFSLQLQRVSAERNLKSASPFLVQVSSS